MDDRENDDSASEPTDDEPRKGAINDPRTRDVEAPRKTFEGTEQE